MLHGKNKIELDIQKATVQGEKDLLEVVIRNLLENANKAEPKDKKILIKGEILENGKYRISVIDKGKGIPKEHIGRVTEDFYMVDKSRSRENRFKWDGIIFGKENFKIPQF